MHVWLSANTKNRIDRKVSTAPSVDFDSVLEVFLFYTD
jgi:hypothetical protein